MIYFYKLRGVVKKKNKVRWKREINLGCFKNVCGMGIKLFSFYILKIKGEKILYYVKFIWDIV